MRTVAKIQGIDHHGLVLPFRGVPKSTAGFDPDGFWDGLCIVAASEPEQATPPDAWTVLDLDEPTTPAEVRQRLAAFRIH